MSTEKSNKEGCVEIELDSIEIYLLKQRAKKLGISIEELIGLLLKKFQEDKHNGIES